MKGRRQMKLEKLTGFVRLYQAESFPQDFSDMFGKDRGEMKRYRRWLNRALWELDERGEKAILLSSFEKLKSEDAPQLYAIRHAHSLINERYLYMITKNKSVILLTAFKEKSASDYAIAIARARSLYHKLDVDDERND